MAFIWHGRHPEGVTVGDWYLNRADKWIYEKDAPTPGQSPAVTQMFNAVPSPTPRQAPALIEYEGHRDYAVTPAPVELVDVPPRVDDWCEDRPVDELTDDDGTD